MAQEGDTITYTASSGERVSEDVSAVDEATVDYLNGPGNSFNNTGGGRVENATIDVSGQDTLYLWVGVVNELGRYDADSGGRSGGSTEISFDSRQQGDGESNLPFLVGAGGAGYDGSLTYGAARGGTGSGGSGAGTPPPQGGGDSVGFEGQGAIDDQNRGLVSGGTTITGGGASSDTNGEIQVTYKVALSPPDPPSNLTAEQQ